MNDEDKKNLKNFGCRIHLFEYFTRKFSGDPPNTLVVLNTAISSILLITLFCLPCIILGFYITLDEIIAIGRLNRASLNCSRDKSEIYCLLTGENTYSNIEKVLSFRHEELLGVRIEISNKENAKDGLIVLITNKQEIFLLTQKSIIKSQTDQLNSFLANSTQKAVKIQTISSNEVNILPKLSFLVFWNFIWIIFIISVIKNIVDSKKYIFDKESNRITVKRILRKDLSLEIEFQKIKQVHSVRSKNDGIIPNGKILFIGNDNSVLLSIDLHYKSSSEIAGSICSFLQLEHRQTIEIPP
jgi:hypothetical protein